MRPGNPLEAFWQAHENTLRQCEALERLVFYLGQCEPDAQSRRASEELLHYFDTMALQDHGREEELLYPALVESMSGSDAACLRELVASLTRQHRLLEAKWASLRREVVAIAAGQDVPGVVSDAEEFIRLARFHIASEDADALPMALRLIRDGELERIREAVLNPAADPVSSPAAAAPSCSAPA